MQHCGDSMKILIVILIFAIAWGAFQSYRLDNAQKSISSLESEKTALTINIERYKNAEVEANKTIKSLRKSAESNPNCLDWSRTPVCVESINELQKRHNRNRAN